MQVRKENLNGIIIKIVNVNESGCAGWRRSARTSLGSTIYLAGRQPRFDWRRTLKGHLSASLAGYTKPNNNESSLTNYLEISHSRSFLLNNGRWKLIFVMRSQIFLIFCVNFVYNSCYLTRYSSDDRRCKSKRYSCNVNFLMALKFLVIWRCICLLVNYLRDQNAC